jgi:hypothetical protein
MKTIRLGVAAITMLLLAAGYAASQRAVLAGDPQRYAAEVDTPTVKWLALGWLVLVVALAFVPAREAETP